MRPKDKEKAEEIARREAESAIDRHEQNSIAHESITFWFITLWIIFILILALWIYHTTWVAPYLKVPADDTCKFLQEKLNGTSSRWPYLTHDLCEVCWQDCTKADGKTACDDSSKHCKSFTVS